MQRVESTIRVDAPVEKVYAYWHDFENFPRFMKNVKEVRSTGDGTLSHWVIEGPLGVDAEFDAKMTEDEPNRTIGWNSTDGNIGTSGVVAFNQTGQQTTVHVLMQWYDPPAGKLGEIASTTLQDPQAMLDDDLRRFKDIVEGRVGSGLRAS